MRVVICQMAPISKSNISTIIAAQFGCFWQIPNLLNSSTFKKAQGTKTQVGWDWEQILLGGSVKGHSIQSRHKIFSQGTKYSVKEQNIQSRDTVFSQGTQYSVKAQSIQSRNRIFSQGKEVQAVKAMRQLKLQSVFRHTYSVQCTLVYSLHSVHCLKGPMKYCQCPMCMQLSCEWQGLHVKNSD